MYRRLPGLSERPSLSATAAWLMASVCLQLCVLSAAANSGSRPEPGSISPLGLQTATGAASQAEIRELKQGQVVERELTGGESHSYRITLASGQYLKAVVEQKGIDVVVRIVGPGEQKLVEVDSDPAVGLESAFVVAEASGGYLVEVQSAGKDAKTGKYEIRLEELREATSKDRIHVAALKSFEEANQLRDQQTAESRRKALKKYEEALLLWRDAGDQDGETRTLIEIGIIYSRNGDQPKAMESYSRALELSRSLGNRRLEAEALIDIGMSHWRRGQFDKAVEYTSQALPLSRASGDRRNEAIALNNIGLDYASMGQLQEALRYYNQALLLRQDVGDRNWEAATLNNTAGVFRRLGELQTALEYYSESLRLKRAVGDRRSEGNTLHNIGATYQQLGELEKALEYYNQAIAISKEVGDPQGEAITLDNLGVVFNTLGKAKEALINHNQALILSRNVGDRRQEAYILSHIGSDYQLSGEPQKALEYFDQALSIRREVGDRFGEAYSISGIGSSYDAMGELPKALEYYHQALRLTRDTGNRIHEAMVLYRIALVERAQGKTSEARAQIESALDIIETTRTKMAGQELRSAFLASNKDLYELYIDLLMRMHNDYPSAGHDARALQASERSRARSLLDMLTEARVDIRQGVDAGLLENERRLQQHLSAKSERLTRLMGNKQTQEQETAARKEVETLLADYQEVKAQIRSRSPRYAALTQPQPLSLKEIQEQVLDKHTLLLEYSLGAEKSYLWTVSSTALSSHQLPKRADIESLARRVYELLTARNQQIEFETAEKREKRIAKAEAEYPLAASALSNILLGPVKAQMKGKRLVIVADGALQYIPFGALPLLGERTQVASSNPTPLLAEHEVVSLPSVSTLGVQRKELADRQPASKMVAVLADPVFDRHDERVKPSKPGTHQGKGSVGFNVQRTGGKTPENALTRSFRDIGFTHKQRYFPRLLATRREAQAIAAVAPPAQSRKVVDFAASKALARDPVLSQYRYVHFATHALINSAHPELSGIVLTLVDQHGDDQDGFLVAHEIYNLKLPAEMIVLSSCKTGLGKEIKGEGFMGLTRGFMYAGAARVLVSLWDINDQSTAGLMERLYRNILGQQRLSPAAALRAAQVSMWKSKRWRSPYYWAAFQLQGEYR